MESVDKELCELFYSVLKNYLTNSLSRKSVKLLKKNLPEIRRKYKGEKLKESLVHSFPSQNLVLPSQIGAYFYECSMCLASSIAKTFLNLTKENLPFINKLTPRKTINISCISGIMASEVVAVVQILSRMIEEEEADGHNYTHFDITFINADNIWDAVTMAVLDEFKLQVNQRYKVKLTSKFVQYKSKKLCQEVLEVFHSCDILVTTKFSQELSNMGDKLLKSLLQVAMEHMKFDSLLFVVDFSAAGFIKMLEKDISKFASFKKAFRNNCIYHTISLGSVESHLECYCEHFGKDLSSSYCLSSAVAWLKCGKRKGSTQNEAPVCKPTVPPYKFRKNKKLARVSIHEFSKSVETLCSQRKW